jgi:hypothetical protein
MRLTSEGIQVAWFTHTRSPINGAHPLNLSALILYLALSAGLGAAEEATPEIHTVLPKDAIPAIFEPTFLPAGEAEVNDDSRMIGVSIGEEHHAYSMVLLNAHEIVNDVVGNSAIATTW